MSNSQKIYMRNLIKVSTIIQAQVDVLANEIAPEDLESLVQHPRLAQIRKEIQRHVQTVEVIFEKKGGSAANLSVRSRRSYQWLKFLNAEENILQHVRVLNRLYQLNANISVAHPKKNFTVKIFLYHIGALYKIQEKGSLLEVTAHEAFIAAPQETLEALINIVYDKNKPAASASIKEFADSEELFAVQQEIEYIGIAQGANAQGEQHNLEDVFKRVNQVYFNNEIAQPHLTWNERRTYRKFGHYQYSTDTLLVSRSLDQPNTPALVLDFVMYHELLHKKLGYSLINGRRYAHTSAFREKERCFEKYRDAQAYLKKLSRKFS
ncbi:MAG: hypothetical protein DRI56_04140 [Chloroflexota bacterium]|nr:MAG: hypothetical protein DRI56_04140 [Chloroflexota bacterium]